jgi:hypothetical protein
VRAALWRVDISCRSAEAPALGLQAGRAALMSCCVPSAIGGTCCFFLLCLIGDRAAWMPADSMKLWDLACRELEGIRPVPCLSHCNSMLVLTAVAQCWYQCCQAAAIVPVPACFRHSSHLCRPPYMHIPTVQLANL